MKNFLSIWTAVLLIWQFFPVAHAQSLSLKITNDSPTTVRVDWASDVNASYRLLSSDVLDPFSAWAYVQDVTTTGTNSSITVSSTSSNSFFKMVVLDDFTGYPTARIIAPTNGQTVNGTISLLVGAQDDSQLATVKLYLDDALVGVIEAGDLQFNLDTSHFTNGTHTLSVAARDNAENETQSATTTVDFENEVRWPDADSLFTDFVLIDVESDIFPADWTVFVEDMAGSTVRTFSGVTSDGLIQTNWDGLDENSVAAPDEAAYRVTVTVTSQNSSFRSEESGSKKSSRENKNAYGVVDYEIEETVDLTESYFAAFRAILSSSEKTVFPPLPPAPEKNSSKTRSRKISARQMFTSENPAAQGASGSTRSVLWREAGWRSANILVARQNITGTPGLVWNGTVGGLLIHIQNTVQIAANSLPANNQRDVYQNSLLLMQNQGNYNNVTNILKSSNPDVRAFYFWSHGSIDGNTIGSGAGNIHSADLARTLGNDFFFTSVGAFGNPYAIRKAFNFVFLDGCMTGNGNFAEAFGIPKIRGPRFYTRNPNVHPRAFMGWGGRISNSILNNNFLNWSRQFWTSWLDQPDQNTIADARDDANAMYHLPNDVPLSIYGTPLLKWGD